MSGGEKHGDKNYFKSGFIKIIPLLIILILFYFINRSETSNSTYIYKNDLLSVNELEKIKGGAGLNCKWIGACTTKDTTCYADGDSIVIGKRLCRLPGNMICCKRIIFVEGCSGSQISAKNWFGNAFGCPLP